LINEQPETHGTDPVPLPFQLTIILISLAVALLTLTAESFWTDELFTRYFIDLDVTLPQAWQRMINEPHPPTYYLALRLWASVFDVSSFSLRAFSWVVFCIILTVPFTPFGSAVLRARRGIFVLLVATSFLLIKFSQEARSYELLALFAMLATFLTVALQRRVIHGMRIESGYALAAATVYPVTVMLHLYGMIFAGVCLLYLLAEAVLRRRRRFALFIIAIGTASLLLEASWIYITLSYALTQTGGAGWISLEILPRELVSFLVKATSGNLLLGLAVLVALLRFGARVWRSPADRMLTIVAFVTVLLPSLASLHTPILIDRFLIVVVPALFYVVSGLMLDLINVQSAATRSWLAFLFGISLAAAAMMQKIAIKPDWEGTAAVVESFISCEDAPVLASPVHESKAYPSVDPRPELFLHSFAGRNIQVILVPFSAENVARVRESGCPIVAWITRKTPSQVEQLLGDHGLRLSDFDSFWSAEAVVLFRATER
jgi:hypothetical protein